MRLNYGPKIKSCFWSKLNTAASVNSSSPSWMRWSFNTRRKWWAKVYPLLRPLERKDDTPSSCSRTCIDTWIWINGTVRSSISIAKVSILLSRSQPSNHEVTCRLWCWNHCFHAESSRSSFRSSQSPWVSIEHLPESASPIFIAIIQRYNSLERQRRKWLLGQLDSSKGTSIPDAVFLHYERRWTSHERRVGRIKNRLGRIRASS